MLQPPFYRVFYLNKYIQFNNYSLTFTKANYYIKFEIDLLTYVSK